jgi:ABC-2 type transport system ATP-binding protein
VGVLTETPGMYDRLSAEYNLLIYARLYEVEQPEKAVQKYLSILELWERRKEAVGGFSKGMKQKLAIARALLHEPQTVFLDEPTSGLDPVAARTVREFIEQLKTEGRTIFLTTHNLDEAERLCDRVGVMRSSLIAVDSPEALRRRLFGLKVRVQLANLADSHRQTAAGLPFVHGVEVENGALLVDLAEPERNQPALSRPWSARARRCSMSQPSEASLEDVYMQLVNGGEAQPAGRGK